jgi:hypothetical protein
VIDERLLQWVKLVGPCQTFNGGDRPASARRGEHQARVCERPVEPNGAGAAFAAAASQLCTGESQPVAERGEQALVIRDIQVVPTAADRKLNWGQLGFCGSWLESGISPGFVARRSRTFYLSGAGCLQQHH